MTPGEKRMYIQYRESAIASGMKLRAAQKWAKQCLDRWRVGSQYARSGFAVQRTRDGS